MKNKYSATISKEEIQDKPLIQFKGNIHIIDNPSQANIAISELNKQKYIGFDTETKPSFKKGKKNKVAILQLATESDAYLFRLHKYFPMDVIDIMESKDIIKIGAAIKDDLSGLQKYHNFNPQGFLELQDFVKQYNIENNGLKKLTAIILDSRISKGQQTSNWENEILSESQQLYASTDAWICLKIYNTLTSDQVNKT